jgi:hypothetical protein
MATYGSPVVSPFVISNNQQHQALHYNTPLKHQSILVVPQIQHLQQVHGGSPSVNVTSSTATTPLILQTQLTSGVSQYHLYQDLSELNPFSDDGDFIDCLRDTDDGGAQFPRDGTSYLASAVIVPQPATSSLDVPDTTPPS